MKKISIPEKNAVGNIRRPIRTSPQYGCKRKKVSISANLFLLRNRIRTGIRIDNNLPYFARDQFYSFL